LKIQIFMVLAVRDPFCIIVPNFAKIAILDFQKFEILNVFSLVGLICIIVPDFIKISQTVAEIWQFNGFQNDGLCRLGF